MNKNEIIEEFIDGNLTDKEYQELKILKDTDPNFNKDIVLRAEINTAIRDINYMELRELLNDNNQIQDWTSVKNKSQYKVLKTWLFAAASFSLLLVVSGIWFIISNKPFSNENQLASKYYKSVHPIMLVRSVNKNTDNSSIIDFKLIQQNDWTNALTYFKSLDNQISAKFYSGICYIELKQYSKAIDSFEYIIKNNDNLFVEQAKWYLGLIYLMNNQKNQAIDQFEKISDSASYYSNQAKEILKSIK